MNIASPNVILYGAAYSVYVRIARLTLEEKGVPYRLEEIDIFAKDGPPPGYLERHPFGRIPAFEHDGFRLFETSAICRYVDEAFEGPALTPGDLKTRALMAQTIGMLDSYAYRAMVWDVYVEMVAKPREGGATDRAVVERGMGVATTVANVLDRQLQANRFLAGDELSLADLHAWSIVDCFQLARPGAELLGGHKGLSAWAKTMAERPSSSATDGPEHES